MKKLVVFLVPIISAIALGSLLWNRVLAEPVLTNNGLTVVEGSNDNVISSSELSVFDAENPGASYTYIINSAPVNGTLALNGAALGVNDEFTQSDIDANQLTYSHNDSETSSDSFNFTVENVTETIASNQTFNINVDPVNDPPVANDDEIAVAEGGTATTLVGDASSVLANDTDPENDVLTAALLTGPTHGTLTLNADGTFEYVHDDSENFSDSFTYNACDPDDACDSATVTIEITPVVDITPEISPGTFNVNEGSGGGTLVGAVTWEDEEVDNGYDSVSFTIVSGNNNNIFLINNDGEIVVRTGQNVPLYESQSQFVLNVQIEDSEELTDTAAITINVTKTNEPPNAANDAMTVNKGGTATTLVGGADSVRDNDSDPDGGPNPSLTVSLVQAPIRGSLTLNANGTFQYTHNNSENFSDSFTYRICDAGTPQKCDTAVVSITINQVVNKAPVINNNPADFDIEIDENEPDNGDVLVTITVTDVEVDAGYDTLTFSISGNTNNAFSITKTGAKTAQLRVASSSQLNHEINPSFELEVTVKDSANLSDTADITITVNDVNEAPVITPGQSFDVDENSPINTVVGTVAFTDPDAGDSHSFAIINGNEPGDPFKIDNNGMIQVNQAILDYETKNSYPLTIRVTDNAGLWDEEIVTIEINDVNEPPEIDAGQSFDIDENSPINTTVGTVTFTDPDEGDTFTFAIFSGNEPGEPFKINNSGVIQVNNAILDFETKSSYTLGIRITDSGGEQDEATVTVQINDVNEKPVIVAGQTFSINENSPVNETVGTVAFNDPDEGDTHTFEILTGNEPNQPFKINNSGVIQVNNAVLDFEAKSSYTLGIKVTDSGNPGLSDQKSVTVQIIDVNEKPTIAAGQSFSVVGFSDNGTVVGTVVASDPDAGDTLTYSITGGNTLGAFAINAGNGRITVNNSDALDFDVRPTFNLSVRVTDNGGLSDTKTVVINITEPPIYTIMLPFVSAARSEEPNNSCSQAYPILLNTTYNTFLPNDQNDFYRFTLASARNVTVELSNFVPINGQILLYRGTCGALTLLGNNGNFSPTKVINAGMQPAGTYHIWIIKDGPSSTTPYNLRVNATP